MLHLIVLACLAAAGLSSSPLNGAWTAEATSFGGHIIYLRMQLHEYDSVVTGTVKDSGGLEPITAGTVDGNQVTFTVVTEFHGEHVSQRYQGTVEDDLIHFRVTAEDDRHTGNPAREFDAHRISRDSSDDDSSAGGD